VTLESTDTLYILDYIIYSRQAASFRYHIIALILAQNFVYFPLAVALIANRLYKSRLDIEEIVFGIVCYRVKTNFANDGQGLAVNQHRITT